jgi:hypothetical protein
METHFPTACSECGAALLDGLTCADHFYQMLAWENEDPPRGVVHHLAVLCYYLQHPSLYSPEGLAEGMRLLVEFVEKGKPPQEIRKANRKRVNSANRNWKITARPDAHGAYRYPVHWKMTVADVVAAGAEAYCESVRKQARLTLEELKTSGNIEA